MLAERLVGALQRENVRYIVLSNLFLHIFVPLMSQSLTCIRWAESMKTLRDQKATLPGDMVLTAAFIAYSKLDER